MSVDTAALLFDQEAIRDVVARYFLGHDRGDFAIVDSCFAPDAKMYVENTLIRGPGSTVLKVIPGTDGILMEAARASTHVMHQSFIRFTGDGAVSETYATAHLVITGQPTDRLLVRALRYFDVLQRIEGRWLIDERRLTLDWMYETELSFSLGREERLQFDNSPV